MRLVQELGEDVLEAIQKEVIRASQLFGKSPRTTYEGSAHTEVLDIILRGPELTEESTLESLHIETECVDYPATQAFPILCATVGALAEDRKIGRVLISALDPEGIIYPHIDEGPVPEQYDRYHICVQGGKGNHWLNGQVPYTVWTGEIWQFNVQVTHSVINLMDKQRIHVVFDLKKEND